MNAGSWCSTLASLVGFVACAACSGPEGGGRPSTVGARARAPGEAAGAPVTSAGGAGEAAATSPAPAAGADRASEDTEAPPGPACVSSRECAAGQRCRGPAGCEAAWACGETGDCSGAVVAYCDCDEVTFYAPEGCPGRPYARRGACAGGDRVAAAAEPGVYDADHRPGVDRHACTSNDDCGGGRVCWGVPGCGTTWSCVRVRGCARDAVPYCGCDGVTFTASSTCPGRPFAHRGRCREDGVEAVAALGQPGGAAGGAPAASGAAAASGRPSPGSGAVSAAPASGPGAGATAPAAGVAAPASAPATGARPPPVPLAPGECRSNRDCARGLVCSGDEGCDGAPTWTCKPPPRACIADTQVFCGCDGRDFRASMTCPGRPHRHRGSCALDRLLELQGSGMR